MTLTIALLFIATIIAFWISAISGGGASLILIPILNFILPAPVIPFTLTIGTLSSSASRIAVFRKAINWKIFFWFVPFSIPAVIFGAYLIKYVNPNYLQFFVALFLITNLTELFKNKKRIEKEKKSYPKYRLALVGFLAGFISGITGAVGLLFNRFYLHYGLTKEEIIATRAANEIFLHAIKLVIYIVLGLYSTFAFWLGITIAVGAIISSYTVKYILPYLSEFAFKKIGYTAMVLSGILLLFSSSNLIMKHDKLSKEAGFYAASEKWSANSFDFEYSHGNRLEIEKTIKQTELPDNLKLKFQELSEMFDHILLEKVFRPGRNPAYEFYCFKNNILTKYDFDG